MHTIVISSQITNIHFKTILELETKNILNSPVLNDQNRWIEGLKTHLDPK